MTTNESNLREKTRHRLPDFANCICLAGCDCRFDCASHFCGNTFNACTKFAGAITVHAAGRGKPWITLSDGCEMPTHYAGAAENRQVLENIVCPLTVANQF
jgi:hypothetical protein